ncbi:MAG: RNA polymerase sigma factor [Firmicutes bacterium]|nr:RNA polymerase sigma factor [Bacillota bacterium]
MQTRNPESKRLQGIRSKETILAKKDDLLMKEVICGNDAALAELIELYEGKLFCFAYRFLGCAQDAEEVVRDTFIAIWQRTSEFKGDSSVRSWVYGICRNIAISKLRRKKVTTACPVPDTVCDPSPSVNPEYQAWRNYRASLLATCVQQLPPAAREALILRIYQELAYEEIARICTCPVGTIRSRLNYAMKRLTRLVMAMDKENNLGENEP